MSKFLLVVAALCAQPTAPMPIKGQIEAADIQMYDTSQSGAGPFLPLKTEITIRYVGREGHFEYYHLTVFDGTKIKLGDIVIFDPRGCGGGLDPAG